MIKNILILLVSLGTISVIAVVAKVVIPNFTKNKIEQIQNCKKLHQERIVNGEVIRCDLLDPEMAPTDIHEQVMYGYNILLYTNKILPQYVDDRLTCANCHIGAGNTLGGKKGGISLVAVGRIYPRFSKRIGKTIDLKERINNCFERSMNGKALPPDSEEMKAIIAYLGWISSEIPQRSDYRWLGLEPLTSTHIPDPKNGAKVYQRNCSMCHLHNGQGTEHNPPLWGPHAFNDGAGMSTLPKLSSFVFYNMPYNDPFLTQEQALDVAAYLVEQRRPIFIQQK